MTKQTDRVNCQRHFSLLMLIQDGACALCYQSFELDIELPHIDHIVPVKYEDVYNGNIHEIDNIRLVCVRCNRNRTEDDYMEALGHHLRGDIPKNLKDKFMPARRQNGVRRKIVSVTLDPLVLARIDFFCRKHGVNRSEMIERLITHDNIQNELKKRKSSR